MLPAAHNTGLFQRPRVASKRSGRLGLEKLFRTSAPEESGHGDCEMLKNIQRIMPGS